MKQRSSNGNNTNESNGGRLMEPNEFSRVVVYTIFIIGYSPKGRKIRKGKVLKYKLYRCDSLWYAICILDIGYNRQ